MRRTSVLKVVLSRPHRPARINRSSFSALLLLASAPAEFPMHQADEGPGIVADKLRSPTPRQSMRSGVVETLVRTERTGGGVNLWGKARGAV